MNKKTILIILISLILIVLAYFAVSRQANGTLENDFLLNDSSNVEKIFMVNKQNQHITLTKDGTIWKLDHKSDAIQENVKILLKTLLTIDIRRPVSKSAYNTVIKQLATHSVKVEIYQRKALINFMGFHAFPRLKKTKVFYVGSPTRDLKGTIMKMADSKDIYITYIPGFNGYLSERFSADYSDWVNHRIFKTPLRSIVQVKVEFGQTPDQSYEINSKGNRTFNVISLQNKQRLAYDTSRVLEELAAFRSINYEALLDNMSQSKIDSLDQAVPLRTVTLTTLDQKSHRVRMYLRPNFTKKPDLNGKLFPYDVDRMYALVDGIKHPVSVQYFVVDNISRPLKFIIGKQKSKESQFKGFMVGK